MIYCPAISFFQSLTDDSTLKFAVQYYDIYIQHVYNFYAPILKRNNQIGYYKNIFSILLIVSIYKRHAMHLFSVYFFSTAQVNNVFFFFFFFLMLNKSRLCKSLSRHVYQFSHLDLLF